MCCLIDVQLCSTLGASWLYISQLFPFQNGNVIKLVSLQTRWALLKRYGPVRCPAGLMPPTIKGKAILMHFRHHLFVSPLNGWMLSLTDNKRVTVFPYVLEFCCCPNWYFFLNILNSKLGNLEAKSFTMITWRREKTRVIHKFCLWFRLFK